MFSPRFVRRVIAGAAIALLAGTSGSATAFVWPNVPEQIGRALKSGDVSERRIAAQRLRELPATLAAPLIQLAVGDPDTEVRLRAADAAVALRIPRAGDLVMSWLADTDPRLRLSACETIRAIPTDRSVVALGRVLGDPDAHVRMAAAAAMGSSGLPDAVAPLLGHLDDTAPEVRAEVARALGRIGDQRAVLPLVGKVQDNVSDVRRVVARALGELGDKRAASALMLALQDNFMEVRFEAVTALGKIRSDDATAAVSALLELEDEPDPNAGMGYPRVQISSGPGATEVRAAATRALGRIGSESAVKILVTALSKDDPLQNHSAVRDALVEAGTACVAPLVTLLGASPSQTAAGGAALVLGTLKATDGLDPIVRGMQRGLVPLKQGLRALSAMGSPAALPSVLELLDDSDPSVRVEAIRTASTLLDPTKPDGRAVDPARESLKDPATPMDERIELVKMLGRTGAPRAHEVLLPLVKSKSIALRLAVIEALGLLRVPSPAVDAALVEALGDELSDVRQKAALALRRAGSGAAAPTLLEKLTVAAEQDRGALGLALSGVMARVTDAAFAEKVAAAVPPSPDVARDALIEGLGQMPGAAASKALAKVAGGNVDDRRKVAEALAGHAEASDLWTKLLADADSGVRANAVWSLGVAGSKDKIAVLTPLVKDPDVAVAGNAAVALGRIGARDAASATVQPTLCAALSDTRSYVRANALAGLRLAEATCDAPSPADLLSRDPEETVRLAAADHVAAALEKAAPENKPALKRALSRCASEERNATVAGRCAKPTKISTTKDDLFVYVVPDTRSNATPRTPFTLVRPDGLLRLGVADRRGAVLEKDVPLGMVRLGVPPPLAK